MIRPYMTILDLWSFGVEVLFSPVLWSCISSNLPGKWHALLRLFQLSSGKGDLAVAPANHCTVTDRSLQPQVDRCNLHVSELKIRRLKVQQYPTFQKNQGLPVTTSWSKPRNTLKHLLRWPRDHRSWYLQGDGTRPQCRPIGNSGT